MPFLKFLFLTQWEEVSSAINCHLLFLNAGQDKPPPVVYIAVVHPAFCCWPELPTKGYLLSANCDRTFCNAEGAKGTAQLAMRKMPRLNREACEGKKTSATKKTIGIEDLLPDEDWKTYFEPH